MATSYNAVVRTSGPPGPLADAARLLAKSLDSGIPAPLMTSMSSTVDDSLSTERLMAMLSVFFAACALIVTAVGLYGTLAYATARRTSEIGIRMALGARRAQVVAMVFRQNASSCARRNSSGPHRGIARIAGAGQLPLWHLGARSLGVCRVHLYARADCECCLAAAGAALGAD